MLVCACVCFNMCTFCVSSYACVLLHGCLVLLCVFMHAGARVWWAMTNSSWWTLQAYCRSAIRLSEVVKQGHSKLHINHLEGTLSSPPRTPTMSQSITYLTPELYVQYNKNNKKHFFVATFDSFAVKFLAHVSDVRRMYGGALFCSIINRVFINDQSNSI